MLKKLLRSPFLLLILSCLLLLTGCFNSNSGGKSSQKITLYFYDEHQNILVTEEKNIDVKPETSNEKIMLMVLETLSKGPQSSNQGARPIQFNIDQSILKERSAFINFTGNYNKLDTPTQIVQRAMLVYTLTELDFIDKVEFFADDVPLTNSNGNKIGPVERKDILVSALHPEPPTSSQIITLYFPSSENDLLYKETREIKVNTTSTPLEDYVIKELIKGPNTPGLIAPLPADTKLNAVNTQDGVSQVDLSYDLQMPQMNSTIKENAVIYSIVNSLTESAKVKKVIFLKDGKKQTEFTSPAHSGGIFERNEDIIAETP